MKTAPVVCQSLAKAAKMIPLLDHKGHCPYVEKISASIWHCDANGEEFAVSCCNNVGYCRVQDMEDCG